MSKNYDQAILHYHNELKILTGEELVRVRYCEIDWGKDIFYSDNYHSIDHGVELEMESGKVFHFMWAEQYQSHDLKFGHGNILAQFPKQFPPPIREMTDHSKWNLLIGTTIVSATCHWPHVPYKDKSIVARYPQDVHLTFENNASLVISSVEIDEMKVIPMTNNITLFFNVETARQFGVSK